MTKNNQIAYKPLGMTPLMNDEEDEPDGGDHELDYSDVRPLHKTDMGMRSGAGLFINLRHVRAILYLVATILLLIFIARLITYNNSPTLPSSLPLVANKNCTQGKSCISQGRSDPGGLTSSKSNKTSFINGPEYDNYLWSVLHERDRNKNQTNEPIDDLQYPEHLTTSLASLSLNKSDIWWTLNFRAAKKYVTVTNYIRAMKSFNYNSSITLTTQGTTEFMYHTLELCKRWDGPISVAVFCPGPEMLVAITLIKYMRQCLPAPLSACISDKVTWHLVYNKAHGPLSSAISYPKYHLDSTNYPLFVNDDQCPKLPGPDAVNSIKQFEEKLKTANGVFPISYRQHFQLPYPINVLRNTARLASSTKYILASDIELYPSLNLVPNFINFIKNHEISEEYTVAKKYVFTLPIFEVKSNVSAPKTKEELVHLFSNGDAIFFHKWVCDACQNFPNREDWLKTDKFGVEDYHANNDELVIFKVTRRDKSRDSWEPIFIGTNEDPLYDDRLTWDGRRDKMGQMYEICLQDYYLFVLGNAFLVHAPGIKHIDRGDFIKKLKYIRENNSIYDATVSNLKQQYANSTNLNKC